MSSTAISTTATSSTLAAQITEVEQKLRHPKHDEIVTGLTWLMKAGMAYPTTIPAGEEVAAYVAVLSNVPSCGLKKALTKLRNGEYENINLAFIPLPAELAAMSRAEAKTEREDLARLDEVRRTLADRQAPAATRASEESKARVRALLANFRAEHKASKEASKAPTIPEEMSPERAEYFRKIQSLPDAPEVTPEQMRHRNAIASRIEAATEDKGSEAA